MVEELIARVSAMEDIFDTLTHTATPDQTLLAILTDYYENGQWLRDYEMDEQGLIPPEVKRGVLSEDGIYNLLAGYLDTSSK